MKHWRKAAALLLALASCLALSGCGAFRTQMTKTARRMAKLESFHTDVEAYLGALLDVGGQKIRMEATVTGGFDTETSPLLIRTDLLLETLGVERELRYDIQKNSESWIVNPWDEEHTGSELIPEKKTNRNTLSAELLKLLARCGDYFADPVDDLVNRAHARRYDGILPDEFVGELLVLLDLERPETADPDNEAEAAVIIPEGEETGEAEEETSAAGETAEAQALQGLPVSFWVDDDDRLVQVDMDFAVFLRELMDGALERLLTEYELDDLDLEGELQYVDARLTLSGFDGVEPLRPQESGTGA
ncbi:MAG: hypothetical protein IJV40_15340 [Oscillospiraceae bacterium]|nr:hypothetical protein [Oscillospiraceae bacterium]